MWRSLRQGAFLLPTVVALWAGCNDAPSPVGAEFLPDTVHLQLLSAPPDSLFEAIETEKIAQPLFNAGVLYIGRFRDLEARTLLRFTDIPDTLGWLSAAWILRATLVLSPERYTLGDSSGAATRVPFTVHRVTRLWTPKATWDSLFATGDAGTLDPLELGRWEEAIPLRDTAEPVRVELNEAGRQLLAEWFRLQADSLQRQQIYGIALIPTGAATAIRAFATQSIGQLHRPAPSLEVLYRRSDRVDTVRLTAGYAGSFLSPSQFDPYCCLILQPGIAYRPALSIQLEGLPPLAALYRAELRLTLDTAACWTGNRERSRTLLILPADTNAPSWLSATATYDPHSGTYVSRTLAPMLEYWFRRQRRGRLFISLPATELYGHLDRLAFSRSGSAAPQLVLIYAVRKRP